MPVVDDGWYGVGHLYDRCVVQAMEVGADIRMEGSTCMDRQERGLAYVVNKFCLFIYCFWEQAWSWSWSTSLHLAIRCFLQIEHKSIVL